MSSIGLAPAELASLVIESCLTGISFVIFFGAIYVLRNKRDLSSEASRIPFNKILFTISVVLLFCVLGHWITNVARAFDAFVYDAAEPGGPTAVFGDLRDSKNVTKTAFYVIEIVIADSILTYRLFVVWGRKKLVIIFPCCATVAVAVSGIALVYEFSVLTPTTNIFESVTGRWILTGLTATLCTNLYSTPLIAYRIWHSNRRLQQFHISIVSRVVPIIVESAAIYMAITLSTFILYLTKSNVQFPTLDATSPIIGIVFCLIIVRTELGIAYVNSSRNISGRTNSTYHQRSVLGAFGERSGYGGGGTGSVITTAQSGTDDPLGGHPLRPLNVHVTHEIDVGDVYNTHKDSVEGPGLGV